VPALEPRLASFELGYDSPSWIVALEAVVGSWLDAGAFTEARSALDRLRISNERRIPSLLSSASESLLRSQLLLVEGDAPAAVAEAERALNTRAPWWRLKAIRALAAAGAASPDQLAEAGALERSLGIERAVDSAPWPGTS
jgi:hypothetical protein